MSDPANIPDDSDGPLFRVRSIVIAEARNRTTGEWEDARLHPETQWTVVKRGDTFTVLTNQPVTPLADLIEQILEGGWLKKVSRAVSPRKKPK